jgi:3-hydroxyisobutyrate dehydrogenase
MNILFIGIGNMGWPMAANLVRAGFDVAVRDAVSGRAGAFVREIGGQAEGDPASADVVITMLPTSAHVAAALDELAPSLRPGTIVVDMSSGVPSKTRRLAETLAPAGIRVVDCPVSGGVARAVPGELAIMAGGDDDAVGSVQPLLDVLGSSVHRCGPVGAGQAMKALNNLVSAAGFLIGAEALLVGQRFGLDPSTMVDVLNASSGRNNSTERKFKEFVLSRAFDSGFGLDLMAKDLGIARGMAEEAGVETPFSAECAELWAAAAAALGPGHDHTEMARYSESLAGTELR